MRLIKKGWSVKKSLNLVLAAVLTAGGLSAAVSPSTARAAEAVVSPGGISTKPVLWLKADDGVSVTSDVYGRLAGWADRSEDPINFTLDVPSGQEARTPTYHVSGVNFNPSVGFKNPTSGSHYDTSAKLLGDKDITFRSGFAVYKSPTGSTSTGVLVGTQVSVGGDNGLIVLGGYQNRFATGNGVTGTYSYVPSIDRTKYQLTNFEIVAPADHTARVDGQNKTVDRNGTFGPFTFKPVVGATRGGGYNWGGLNADVAEIILYDDLTSGDAAKIETYLAVKYGITLNDGLSDYISTIGGVIWSSDAVYRYNIAGIGRDDSEGLTQKQSRSINADTQVAIGTGSLADTNADNAGSLADGQYLIWGDNGLPLNFDQPTAEADEFHAQRVWKAQNTNHVGEVQIAIPVSAFEGGQKLLVSDSDSDFSNAAEYELDTIELGGEPHYAARTTLTDGKFFTFSVQAPAIRGAQVSEVTPTEDEIILTFDQEIDLSDLANLTGFELEVNGGSVPIVGYEAGTDGKTLKLKIGQEIDPSDSVRILYPSGNLKGTNGAPVQSFDYSIVPPPLTITDPSDGRSSAARPEIKGESDKDAVVTLTLRNSEGIVIGPVNVPVDNDGKWSFTPSADLADGDYTIEVTATKDGKSTSVSEPLTIDTGDRSALTGLQLNSWNGTPIGVSPVFDSGTYKYSASVANSVYGVTLESLALFPGSTIQVSVNGGTPQTVDSGTASGLLPLNVGANTIIVKVTDDKGNETEYEITVTRAGSGSSGGGSGSGGTPSQPEDKSGIQTSVNDKDEPFATGTVTDNGGRSTTAVQVDPDKLKEKLAQGSGQKLKIHSPNEGDVKVDGLTAADVKQIADKGASLEISNPLAIYPVPGGKMDLSGVSGQLGNAALGDIAVHIDIKRSPEALINNAQSQAASKGYELLVPPVDLDLTFTSGGKTVRSEQLNGYAPKYIALPEGIDPNRITTGVIVNPDGSVFHVPTVVTKIDSRYYALINDLRSSGSYSVIWNPQDFDDVRTHWGKADVNNIAARLSLAGNGDNTFSPDRNVTRSEFSEIVVVGLGLMRQSAPQNQFPDVPALAWYRNSVAIANEFDIVRGYNDGNFYGTRQITREQGFAMIARALRLINPQASLSEQRIGELLSKYEDAANVSAWAREDAAQLIAAGIVQGNGADTLKPKTNMTRAEVTALIARLLKTTELIDK